MLPASPNRSLRIVFLIDDFFPASGGIARSVEIQAEALTQLGHTVTVCAPRKQLGTASTPYRVVGLPYYHVPKTAAHFCSLAARSTIAQQLHDTYHPDVVHSQTERGALLLAAQIARRYGTPHVHTFHANLAASHHNQPVLAVAGTAAYACCIAPRIERIAQPANSIAVAPPTTTQSHHLADRLAQCDWRSLARIAACVSAYTTPASFMREAIDHYLPTSHHGVVIPTGVGNAFAQAIQRQQALAKQRRQGRGPLRFLSVCRLAKEKRVHIIIKAFLLANLPNAELHIVGDGDQRRALERLANHDARIRFHGHAATVDTLAEHYTTADVFVMASIGFDTQGITLLEAGAAGLPIIYCDERLTTGVDNRNSILTTSPAAADFASAMQCLTNTNYRQSLARHSRMQAAQHSARATAQRYLNVYQRLMQPVEDPRA